MDRDHTKEAGESLWIFGYGSLICPLSRAITAPALVNCDALPALISAMERTWSARIRRPYPKHGLDGWTAMGIRLEEGCR